MIPPGGNYRPNRINVGYAGSRGAKNADAYLTSKVMTASQPELLLLLFEQFFELTCEIKAHIREGSPALAEPGADRARAIVDELINTLDFGVEMSKDIGAIYYYARNRIFEANLKFDAAIWDHVVTVMRPLYDAFKIAAQNPESAGFAQPATPAGNPSIVAGMTYGHGALNEVVVNTRGGLQA